MTMLIAIPAECVANEPRVAATPDTVKKLVAMGHSVVVQSGAGLASALPDQAFRDAGATIADSRAATYANADIVLKVRAPLAEEIAEFKEGASLIGMLNPYANAELPALAS